MRASYFGVGVFALAVVLSGPAPASADTSSLIKILQPIIERELVAALSELTKATAPEVRKPQVAPTVGEDQLILARKSFDVKTTHWRSWGGSRETEVWLTSLVPCEGLYGIRLSQIECTCQATPQLIIVDVKLPPVALYKLVPDYARQEKAVASGLTPQWFVQGTIRKLEAEIPATIDRLGNEKAAEFLDEVNAMAARQLQTALQTQMDRTRLPGGPSIYVRVR